MPREVGDWTRDKLKILSAYLPGYLGATTTARERIYIDAFAGPGQNVLRKSRAMVDGSPLIALKAKAKNGTVFDRLIFIEKSQRAAAELEQLVGGDPRATVIRGDVNDELPQQVARLPKNSPTFVLLDTDGIEPRWETVVAISGWRTELLVNFPLGMSMKRNPDSQKVSAYFGTDACRPLLKAGGAGSERALLDLYKSRLDALGYHHTTEDDRLVKTQANRRLYYLLFVSKLPVAKRIMDWVFRQPDARGQAPLF